MAMLNNQRVGQIWTACSKEKKSSEKNTFSLCRTAVKQQKLFWDMCLEPMALD